MTWSNICFYSHFGNGDIFNSREIIRELINRGDAEEYFYAHSKGEKILKDLPLTYSPIRGFMNGMSPFIKGQANDLYINTWIGRDSKYVLPGIGCTLLEYIRMFNDILSKLGMEKLSGEARDYIPIIDYDVFELDSLSKWLNRHKEKKVLISNGPVHSNQAINFDFTPIIKTLAETYSDVSFIVTQNITPSSKNIFYTGDIIKASGSDLNEISYLSTHCDLIIGRSSGPFVFTQVIDNYMNPEKTFISFTKHRNASNLIRGVDFKAKFLWSQNTYTEDVVKDIEKVL